LDGKLLKMNGRLCVHDACYAMLFVRDILGFDARLYKTQHKVNSDRRFVINYFMADNTIKIFEKPHPNTGRILDEANALIMKIS